MMQHRLWRILWLPGLLYALLLLGGIYLFGQSAAIIVSEQLLVRLGIRNWVDSADSALLRFTVSFTGFIWWVMLLQVYGVLFRYIWLALSAPLLLNVFGKVEALTRRQVPPSPTPATLGRFYRLLVRNLLWQLVYLLALCVVSLVPVVGWVIPFLVLLMECYYQGFGLLDAALARHGVSPAVSIRHSGRHKGYALGQGMVYYAFHLVPLLGWLLAPAYGVLAAVATAGRVVQQPEYSK
jgi:CysZ protein